MGVLTASVASVHLPWHASADDERVRRQMLDEALGEVSAPTRLAHRDVVCVRNKLRHFSPRLGPPASAPLHRRYCSAGADVLDRGARRPIEPVEGRCFVEPDTALYTSAPNQRLMTLPQGPEATFWCCVSATNDERRAARPSVSL